MLRKKYKSESTVRNMMHALKTKQEANELLIFVDTLRRKTHKTENFDIEKVADDIFVGDQCKPSWVDVLMKNLKKGVSKGSVVGGDDEGVVGNGRGTQKIDMEGVRFFLDTVEDLVRDAELIKLEVPFNPSKEFVDNIYELFRGSGTYSNDRKLFLLDIKKIKKGGDSKIFIRGKCIDLGIRKFVTDYLLSKDVINRYL